MPDGATLAQFALRWILDFDAVSTVDPGSEDAGAGAGERRRRRSAASAARRRTSDRRGLPAAHRTASAPALVAGSTLSRRRRPSRRRSLTPRCRCAWRTSPSPLRRGPPPGPRRQGDDRSAEAAARHASRDARRGRRPARRAGRARGWRPRSRREGSRARRGRARRARVDPARPATRAGDAGAHALVLGDDVAQPAERDLVDARGPRRGLRLVDRDLRRGCPAEGRERALELGAPGRVAGVLEPVADARSRGRRWRARPGAGRAGAPRWRSRAGARSRDERAGTPPGPSGRRARRLPGARPRAPRARARSRELEARRPAEGQPDRDRQRRRGRQAGADRHRRGHAPSSPTAGRPRSASSSATAAA